MVGNERKGGGVGGERENAIIAEAFFIFMYAGEYYSMRAVSMMLCSLKVRLLTTRIVALVVPNGTIYN